MVTFLPTARWRFHHLKEMKDELEGLFGHRVDVVEKRVVEQSANYIRRAHILGHAETVYVA